jgi:hypothetical protein
MKISAFKRFLSEQFQGAPEWFVRFLQQLNLLTEQVVNSMTKNLTIYDNLDAQVFTFSILAGATADLNKVNFESTMKGSPIAVLVGSASSDYTTLTNPVQVFWTVDGKTVKVNSITGLTAGATYKLNLLIF